MGEVFDLTQFFLRCRAPPNRALPVLATPCQACVASPRRAVPNLASPALPHHASPHHAQPNPAVPGVAAPKLIGAAIFKTIQQPKEAKNFPWACKKVRGALLLLKTIQKALETLRQRMMDAQKIPFEARALAYS